jgi:hypothetical protein
MYSSDNFLEFTPESESFESEQFEFSPHDRRRSGAFNEDEATELALELMSVSSEAELDQFLGSLVSRAWSGIKKVGSAVGKVARPFAGILKGVAKTALPFVGGALGSLIPVPGVGTAIGSALGRAVSQALEAEFQGLEAEDRDFEMARRFVQMAGTAAKQVAMAPPGVDPVQAARQAITKAAQNLLPAMAGSMPVSHQPAGMARTGRWIRRGRNIIILNG